jgi:ketosteroid isomerase-like protein
MYRLHGFAQSGNAYKVAVLLQALGQPWTPVHPPFTDLRRAGSAANRRSSMFQTIRNGLLALTLWLALGLPGAASAADAKPGEVPADLAARVHAYDEAQVKGDKAALEDLVADDYVLVNSRGQRQSKADLIRDYTKPGFKLEPFVIEEPVEIVWSDGAVMGGVARIRGVDDGEAYDIRLRFSDIWAKRNGKWRVIYTHASRAS